MQETRIEVFGGPRVVETEPVALSPYQMLLLTLVAGHGPPGVTRQRIAWLLWGEDSSPTVRHRVRQLLHGVRARVGREPFEVMGVDGVRLAASGISCDLRDFERLLDAGQHRSATELMLRGFAPHLPPPPTNQYADWLDARARALRRRAEASASRAWDAARKLEDWKQARDAAEALHALAPDDETVLRCVIEGRARTGSLQAAEAAYRLFEEGREEDAPAHPETLELMERVRSLRRERAPKEAPVPLVGRAEQLALVKGRLDEVAEDAMEIVVITGDAGIGKTRLLEEVRKEARLLGYSCLSASPVEVERPLALNPLVDALLQTDVARYAQGIGEPWRTLVAAFLPADTPIDRLPEVPPVQESGLSRRLLDAFSILLTAVAEDVPTCLLIDDLQWADDTTLAVLQFAKRRWTTGKMALVSTVRSPERALASRYLEELLALDRLDVPLAELTEAAAGELVRAIDPGLRSTEVTGLVALGGRNPFYLLELTKDYQAGRLKLPEVPSETVTVPISLRELFERRAAGLGEVARRVAELVAVRSRPHKLMDLASLAELSLDRCAEGVDELLERRFVRVEQGSVTPAHEIFRSAFHARIPPARLAVLHLQVAEHLLATVQPVPHGELAVHYAQAGESDLAVTHGRGAATEAVANGAIAEAIYFLRIVVDNERREREKAEATADLARLLHVNREIGRAAPLLELASSRLRRVGRVGRALRMETRRAGALVEIADTSVPEAVERLQDIKTEARSIEDWEALALALDTELHLLHRVGDVTGVRALFSEMRECAGRGSPAAACLSNAGLALNILFGDPKEALTCAREALRIAEEEGLDEHRLMAQTRLLLVLLYQGHINSPEVSTLYQQARKIADKDGNLALRFYLESNMGIAKMDAGELDAARGGLAKAAKLVKGLSNDTTKVNLLYNLGELSLASHDFEAAWRYFTESEAMLDGRPLGELNQLLVAGRGYSCLMLGQLKEARAFEADLGADPPEWTFDPTLLVAFRSRLLESRGDRQLAIDRVGDCASRLRDRLPVAWLKLTTLRLRLLKRTGRRPRDLPLAAEALTVADSLSLPSRALEIRALIS